MPIDTAFKTFLHLETENLLLRKIQLSDAASLFNILGDEAVTQFYDDDAFMDISQAEDQINAWENGYQNRRCIRWAITQKGEGDLIGTCGYYGFHNWYQRAGIGYELGSKHWRQGIMTEALWGMLDYGFEVLELNRVEAVIMPGNTASIKMLENRGFRREGLLEEYERWGSKGLVDLYMYAMLKSRWVKG